MAKNPADKARLESRMDAARAGRARYLSESPCPTCGKFERYTTSGSCPSCASRRAKEYRDELRAALKRAKEAQEQGA